MIIKLDGLYLRDEAGHIRWVRSPRAATRFIDLNEVRRVIARMPGARAVDPDKEPTPERGERT